MANQSTTRSGARLPSVHVTALTIVLVQGLALAGCRFGGTGENPFAETRVADAAPLSGGDGGASGTADPSGVGGASDPGAGGAAPSSDGSGGFVATVGDASPGSSAGGAAAIVPAGDGSAGTGSPTTSCDPPAAVAICDPVKNIGCILPVSFCDIDPTQSAPTGRCVLPPNPAPTNTAVCEVTVVSETCAPLSSCVNGACRKLCYCDSDCQTGECCTDPAPGPPNVFKLCKPC